MFTFRGGVWREAVTGDGLGAVRIAVTGDGGGCARSELMAAWTAALRDCWSNCKGGDGLAGTDCIGEAGVGGTIVVIAKSGARVGVL